MENSLGVQSGLAVGIIGGSLSGYIYVSFEIQRYAATQIDGHSRLQQYSVGLLLGCLQLYLNESAFALLPYHLGLAGFNSRYTWFIYPVVYQVAALVAWWTGYLPIFDLRACGQLCLLWMDNINGRIRIRDLDASPCANSKSDSLPKNNKARQKYSYKRLTGESSIRIARIRPSLSLEGPIRCEVVEETLDSPPPYIALSYAWDGHEGKVSVICNGSNLSVTPNCARALRQIRELHGRYHAVDVWVDAICIDQGSDPDALSERSQQVQIVGEVYKKATHVIAWLGDHQARSQEICDYLVQVSKACLNEENETQAWAAARNVALEMTRNWMGFTYNFRNFFRRSWFQRLWPVQEATLPLPGKVTLLCGDSLVPFDYVRVGWQILTDIGLVAGSLNLDQAVALQFYISDALALKRSEQMTTGVRRFGRPFITDLSSFSLTSVMRATRFKSCSVAKDKFFALYGVFKELGMIHDSADVDAIRYAQLSDNDVFFVVFMLCFAKDRDLNIIKSARSHERYLTHDDFWATQLDPYDTSGNTVLSLGVRLRSWITGHIKEEAPQWRTALPSFVPDWMQWTPGDMDDSDIALFRSYSATQLWNMRPVPTCGIEKRPRVTLLNPQHGPKLLQKRRSPSDPSKLLPSGLLVRAKVVGVIRSTGAVDSVAVLWDIVASSFNFYGYRVGWHAAVNDLETPKIPFFRLVPEAVVAAIIESVRNFVLNSTVAPVLLCLRSIYRECNLPTLVTYARSCILVWSLWPHFMRWICSSYQSATASCSAVGSSWTVTSYRSYPARIVLMSTVYHYYQSRFFGSRFFGREFFYRLFRKNAHFAVISGTCLLWTFRDATFRAMYGEAVADPTSRFMTIVQIGLMSQGISLAGTQLEDNIVILLVRMVMAINTIFLTIGLALRTRLRYVTMYVLTTLMVHASSCAMGTLKEVIGSNSFKRPGTMSSGLTFFTTDTWLTGNTGGAVQLFDVVTVIDGVEDPMILRRRGKLFEIVAVAYVGNKTRKELIDMAGPWQANILQ
ncbi:hypothetical protein N0V83_010057 [Neocucurbitaria cava]|uniref:Heterokaryon incompatibility domain-containing protein n=1 Tax=Neocucurbitaria cava TaxID=798079 RepID=A0A9W8XZ46_9PLEO|nr:hypothetical protein N0V83_010057 [Neocucurbitaria cava]